MTDTNVNLSAEQLLDLRLSRRMRSATRKSVNKRRYERRYARVGLHEIECMVPCPVLVTIELHVLS